jgi:hypothetical protein
MKSIFDLQREHLRNGVESGPMDWVEKRAERRDLLANGSRALVEELKLAIRHAIGSYNNFYPNDGRADSESQYHNALVVSLRPRDGNQGVRAVAFEFEDLLFRSVEVTFGNGRKEVYEIDLRPETKQCCFRSPDGELLGPEEVSERTLKPFFFPA